MVGFHHDVVVVVVFFTLTDRASTIPSNIRGCQSGTWSAGCEPLTCVPPRAGLAFDRSITDLFRKI